MNKSKRKANFSVVETSDTKDFNLSLSKIFDIKPPRKLGVNLSKTIISLFHQSFLNRI